MPLHDEDSAYATLADLAELAGVSRQAVWNWSRRKSDFPKPASEGPNGPLYRVGEFRRWLAAQGRELGSVLGTATSGPGGLFDEAPETAFQSIAGMSPRKRKQLRQEIGEKIEALQTIAAELDPIRQPEHFFDPTNPSYMGRFTAAALLIQPRHPLTEVEKFYGSGVYALYYRGEFSAYRGLSGSETPIYTGKADPAIAHAGSPSEQGDALSRRISEHRKSIETVTGTGGIRVDEFEIRYLVTSSGFQTTAETFLINYFRPVWNRETKICFGIGKHGDDSETRRNKKSPWDTLHPGRKWAEGNEELRTPKQITKDIANHLKANPPIEEIDFNRLLLG